MAEPSASTQSQWDSLTKEFGSGHWAQPLCQLPLLKSLLEKLAPKPWKGLDVGCGLGIHTRLMLQTGEASLAKGNFPRFNSFLSCWSKAQRPSIPGMGFNFWLAVCTGGTVNTLRAL